MSNFAKIVKNYYEAGRYSTQQIVDFLAKGKITEEEYAEIIGEADEEA